MHTNTHTNTLLMSLYNNSTVFNVDTAKDLVTNDYQQLTNMELTATEQEVGYHINNVIHNSYTITDHMITTTSLYLLLCLTSVYSV